jgi:oxidase EvaA
VVAVHARATNREVDAWRQPLIRPVGQGLLAIMVKRINGVPHVLTQARVDAGTLNVAELAPTVQCHQGNYRDLASGLRPPFLDRMLSADRADIRYDTVHSEEGGRFYQAQNRCLVVEANADFPGAERIPDNYRWLSIGQLNGLLAHSNYLNLEIRTLLTCLQSLR